MKLTENFTLEELTTTNTGLPNVPTNQEQEKLLYLATYILQPIRSKFGRVVVNSGFRSDSVNLAIGGAKASQHRYGEAADIDVPGVNLGMVYAWCRENLKFGQLIEEFKGDAHWIHISLPRIGGTNQQTLKFKDGVYSQA